MWQLRTSELLRWLLAVGAAVSIAACSGADDDADDEDGAGGDGDGAGDDDGGDEDPALVGAWSGLEVGDTGVVWTFTMGATDFRADAEGTEVYSGTYTVDTTADPDEITVLITDSDFEEYVDAASNGIYDLDGDELTFAAYEPGDARRPTSFTPGDGCRVFELTRQ